MLRKEKNLENKIPFDLEKAKYFMKWLYTIWDAAKAGMLDLVVRYVNNSDYEIN